MPDLILLVRRDGVLLGCGGGDGVAGLRPPDGCIGKPVERVWPEPLAGLVRHTVRKAIELRAPSEATFEEVRAPYELRAVARGPDRAACVIRALTRSPLEATGEYRARHLDRRGFLRRFKESLSVAALRENPIAIAAIFLEHLLRYVADMGIDARLLQLEVTESMFAEQPAQLARTLQQIRSRGIRIALDDFGTGYSSLALLQLLPFDVLKIDRAFINGMGSGTGDAIVKAIIALAAALGKDLVAEGIETEAQARALIHRGCSSAQGFYFAPALPADDFVRFFHEHQSFAQEGAA
jgi:hypothetical protein